MLPAVRPFRKELSNCLRRFRELSAESAVQKPHQWQQQNLPSSPEKMGIWSCICLKQKHAAKVAAPEPPSDALPPCEEHVQTMPSQSI